MSLFMNILKANNGDSILPKTRSEWVYRANNNDLESDLSSVTNTLKSGLLIQCNHSKTGTIHTLTGIPENMGDLYTARFKATGDFTDGDNFNINGASYLVKAFNNSEIGTNGFKNGGIVECDISPIDSTVFLRAKSPNIPPYNPLDPPQFTYTGTYQTVIEPDGAGWYIQFTSSGTFTLHDPETLNIDVCAIGGGGGGMDNALGAGGGSGKIDHSYSSIITKNAPVMINVGSGGLHTNRVSNPAGNGGSSSVENIINVVGGDNGGWNVTVNNYYYYGSGHAGGGAQGNAGEGVSAAQTHGGHGGSGITGANGTSNIMTKYGPLYGLGDGLSGAIFGNGNKYGYAGGGGGGAGQHGLSNGAYIIGGNGGDGGGPNGGKGGAGAYYNQVAGDGGNGDKGSTGGKGGTGDGTYHPGPGGGGGGGGGYGGGGGAGGARAFSVGVNGIGGNGAPGIVFVRNARSAT